LPQLTVPVSSQIWLRQRTEKQQQQQKQKPKDKLNGSIHKATKLAVSFANDCHDKWPPAQHHLPTSVSTPASAFWLSYSSSICPPTRAPHYFMQNHAMGTTSTTSRRFSPNTAV